MEKHAVIVAGGSGLRMNTSIPKQFLLLNGKPVIWHTLNTFLNAFPDIGIVLVASADHLTLAREVVQTTYDPDRIQITTGGTTRFHSVKNGLDQVHHHSIIFVHDGVRCLLTTDLIHRCYDHAKENGNAIPAVRAIDTIRIEHPGGNEMIDRNKVRIVQTPQTFDSKILKAAYELGYQDSFTDEASVVERLGTKIHLLEGETTNLKITTPIDLMIAEKILETRNPPVSS